MPEYTILSALSVLGVILLERRWRTGIFTSARYWCSMAIVAFFQVLVDGWLTKLSDPIVLYGRRRMLGLRFPWDIPVEDFMFGFSMVTLTILLWERAGRRGTGRTDGKTDDTTSTTDTTDTMRTRTTP